MGLKYAESTERQMELEYSGNTYNDISGKGMVRPPQRDPKVLT